jgi:PelA/Pel-15E family pectate lyase
MKGKFMLYSNPVALKKINRFPLLNKIIVIPAFVGLSLFSKAQDKALLNEAAEAMKSATRFMVEEVSTNGGYLWYYKKDMSRRWGEMEAYKTMIWLQHPGTVSMGHIFLDAYKATGDNYYYEAARKAANAIIWGQSHEGGWNYMVDFAGDRSLKQWYSTIGKNGWRLEEFQHYYGNATFDDDVTSDAARFLLRMYLEKLDPAYKPALEKAIGFILSSQYPNGGWPQRYPLKYDFQKQGHRDYSSFYTFNDDVIAENVNFLIQCYQTLGEERFLEPIRKGMYFYLLSQDSSGAWAQQLDSNMHIAGARTYEPAALLPSTTCENAFLLLKYYQYTGDKKFIQAVPRAISWLERTVLPEKQKEGNRTHPTFVEPRTSKPLYVHRKGSNVVNGKYYFDYDDKNLLAHYGGKHGVPLEALKREYSRLLSLDTDEVTKDSPFIPEMFTGDKLPQQYIDLRRYKLDDVTDTLSVKRVIKALDSQNRWLVKQAMISNPYIGDGEPGASTLQYATTMVGDATDTSPFMDMSEAEYISTAAFIRNMRTLIGFMNASKEKE